MAKCKMKRIEIAALLSDSKKIVERLQRRGVVEICDNTDEELVRLNTQAMIGVFEKNLNFGRAGEGDHGALCAGENRFVRLPTGAARAHHRSFLASRLSKRSVCSRSAMILYRWKNKSMTLLKK